MGTLGILKSANLGARFLLELCILAALAYWGFQVPAAVPLRVALGIAAPLLAAVVWGCFGAPKAPYALHGLALLALEVVVFGCAALALALADRPWLALAFAVVFLVNRALLAVWDQ